MSEITKVTSSHVSRIAIVYVRQSSATQVENNRESTARQYALKQRAEALGWCADRIVVIDDDLGLSGATAGTSRKRPPTKAGALGRRPARSSCSRHRKTAPYFSARRRRTHRP